jgi:hypothetical protein
MATATREADDPRPFFVMLARIIPQLSPVFCNSGAPAD